MKICRLSSYEQRLQLLTSSNNCVPYRTVRGRDEREREKRGTIRCNDLSHRRRSLLQSSTVPLVSLPRLGPESTPPAPPKFATSRTHLFP